MVQGLVEKACSVFREDLHLLSFMPWVENHQGPQDGLLRRLSERCCSHASMKVVWTYLPLWVMGRAAETTSVRLKQFGSLGFLPLQMSEKDCLELSPSFAQMTCRKISSGLFEVVSRKCLHQVSGRVRSNDCGSGQKCSEILEEVNFEHTPLEWMWRVAQGKSIGRRLLLHSTSVMKFEQSLLR